MPLPDRIILWLLTAWLAVFLPPANEPQSYDSIVEPLAAKVFPGADAGTDAWPAIERATAQVHQSSSKFADEAEDRFPGTFVTAYEPVVENADVTPDQHGAAAEMQREFFERLAEAGVWRTLAEAATAPRCRPPLVRYSDMRVELFSSLRIAAQAAGMQARLSADRGDWRTLQDALLSIKSCARAAEARGTMIAALVAFALDRVFSFSLCESLPRTHPTAEEIRSLRESLAAARARRLTLAQTIAFEAPFWFDNEAVNRNFADRWPVNGVRRSGELVLEIGVLDLSSLTGQAPSLWPKIAVAMLGPLLADRSASRMAIELGLRAFVRETQTQAPPAAPSGKAFDEYARAMPLQFILESRALVHSTTIMRRATGLMSARETIDGGLDLVLALAAYRAEHGVYPPTLASLVPGHIDTIPRDPHAPDGRFRYRPSTDAKTYTLYSVGLDAEDNNAAASEPIGTALESKGKGTDYVFVPYAGPNKQR
jgi:hypothetical protein